MARLTILALTIGLAAAQFVTPTPSVMPSWLVPYPGSAPQDRQQGNTAESTYTVAAPPRDVLSHFRSLFASASLPFDPSPMGHGFLIHAAAPECDLAITIRRFDPNTQVKVTCSPRLASTERIINQQTQSRAEHAQSDPMAKFDTPVYPQAKAPQSPLTWPTWLTRVDGAKLTIEKFPGQLKSSFKSSPTREAIQYFYADLLTTHGYKVAQSLAAVPEKFGSWIQASIDPAPQLGRRVVIWIRIKPDGPNFAVELSMQ